MTLPLLAFLFAFFLFSLEELANVGEAAVFVQITNFFAMQRHLQFADEEACLGGSCTVEEPPLNLLLIAAVGEGEGPTDPLEDPGAGANPIELNPPDMRASNFCRTSGGTFESESFPFISNPKGENGDVAPLAPLLFVAWKSVAGPPPAPELTPVLAEYAKLSCIITTTVR